MTPGFLPEEVENWAAVHGDGKTDPGGVGGRSPLQDSLSMPLF